MDGGKGKSPAGLFRRAVASRGRGDLEGVSGETKIAEL
jgi:hypothetical protein